MTPSLIGTSGHPHHRDRRRHDHVGKLGEQIIAAAADALSPVQPAHADVRLSHLTNLLRQLQQLDLGGYIAVMRGQLANLIPHGFHGAFLPLRPAR